MFLIDIFMYFDYSVFIYAKIATSGFEIVSKFVNFSDFKGSIRVLSTQ